MNTFNVNAISLRFVIFFIILILVQVLICNQIALFGVAVPIIYIYFILSLPMSLNVNIVLSLAFLSGFLVDVFSDTLGLNSLSCLVMALTRRPVFYAYVPNEEKYKDAEPSLITLGWENYIKFLLTETAIFCFVIFFLEFLSVDAFKTAFVMFICSTILSFGLMLGIDSLVKIRKENW